MFFLGHFAKNILKKRISCCCKFSVFWNKIAKNDLKKRNPKNSSKLATTAYNMKYERVLEIFYFHNFEHRQIWL
jgi:hypothetical protein